MNEVKARGWFMRGGLFAKYVLALVGLVVFVLAVNGAIETWISYRGIKSTLNDAMGERADATATRIEQAVADLERQISWVTRASSNTLDWRRNDYTQLLGQVHAVSQLTFIDGQGREQLRLSRQTMTTNSNADLSRDLRFTETVARGTAYGAAFFRDDQPFMSIGEQHSGNVGVTVAEIDLRFLEDFLGDSQVGRLASAYVVDPRGRVLATSSKGPDIGKDVSKLPQVASLLAANSHALPSGKDSDGNDVITTSSALPKLGWFVIFEQPTAQALSPIRDQLVRIALLIALGRSPRSPPAPAGSAAAISPIASR